MDLGPRQIAPVIVLVAVVPVVLYMLAREQYFLVLSVACVLLIAGSLYTMFSPVEGHGGHDEAFPR